MKLSSRLKDFYYWAVLSEGSSRTSALIRIGLVITIWARWGRELSLFNAEYPYGYIFSVLFYLCTTLMFIGYYSNLSTFITGLATLTFYYYYGFALGKEPWTHHHTYLLAISTFLCCFTPCGKSYSVDRYLKVKNALKNNLKIPKEIGNLFGLRLLSLQLAAVYFWTAYDKTNWVWVSGQKMTANIMAIYTGSRTPDFPLAEVVIISISVGVLILEYALSVGLFFRLTRKYLLIAGIIFHALIYIALPVRTFTMTVFILYLSFIDTKKVHALIDNISGHTKKI